MAQQQTPWWLVIVTALLYMASRVHAALTRSPGPTAADRERDLLWLEHEVLEGDLGHLSCQHCLIARAKGDGLLPAQPTPRQ